jgi:hypothetical protein
MAIGEKGQSTLWLNPRRLPSLGSVGIHLDIGKYSGNGVPTGIHLLGVVTSGIHLLGAINFALCIQGTRGKSTGTPGKSTGTRGKGTLRTYPFFRVPTVCVF